ncbi:MAG: TraR/DksA family transcriptional regulator [Acidobacteria bacterium]|nr:TraR/DksA family transcriptional regulator [Acidobacteriota bacterium]
MLRARLVEERENILKAYRRDLQTGQESVSEASEDMVDRATVAYSRELAFSISDSERTQLRLVDEALARMAAGTYGVCQYSGQPIGFKRLQVVPWARFRVEYQEMMEQGLLTLDN